MGCCPTIYNGMRCTRPEGHSGYHAGVYDYTPGVETWMKLWRSEEEKPKTE